MRVDAFDFDLPEQLIALRPARPRDSARLLCVAASGLIEDAIVADAPAKFRRGDLLVFNDTRVIPAALRAVRPSRATDRGEGVSVTLNLIARLAPDCWRALARPGKRLNEGDVLVFMETLRARVKAKGERGEIDLSFSESGEALDAALAVIGAPPLPPYIAARRAPDADDTRDYQTIYAKHDGAVAAPTAGLHFTEALLDKLKDAGVALDYLTLHVGAGTFLPVASEHTDDHVMHAEWREISAPLAERIAETKAAGGRVIAIGTTTLRSLESAADEQGRIAPCAGETDIFITPGYRFNVVDGLWTNFHLPRSTLFMLIAAFVGLDRAHAAYAHAIAQRYRFYSYGDACLFWRAQ